MPLAGPPDRARSIVNISSIAGLHAAPGLVAYGASSWAIRGLTRAAANELAPEKINASMPCIPGRVALHRDFRRGRIERLRIFPGLSHHSSDELEYPENRHYLAL